MKHEQGDYNHIKPALYGAAGGTAVGIVINTIHGDIANTLHRESLEPRVEADQQQLATDQGYVRLDSHNLHIPFFGIGQKLMLAAERQTTAADNQALTTEIGFQRKDPNVSNGVSDLTVVLALGIGALAAVRFRRSRATGFSRLSR